jgi:hypothetical protein
MGTMIISDNNMTTDDVVVVVAVGVLSSLQLLLFHHLLLLLSFPFLLPYEAVALLTAGKDGGDYAHGTRQVSY